MRSAALPVVLALAMVGPAWAGAKPDNGGATWTYLKADYSFGRTVYANLSPAGERAVSGVIGRIGRECPHVLAGAPAAEGRDRLGHEVGIAVLYAALTPDVRPALDFARTVGRLRFTDGRLTRLIRLQAAANRSQARLLLALPDLCADARAWVSSGYRRLSASTVRFLATTEGQSAETEVEPLPMLARYEGPRARRLARRIKVLQEAVIRRFPAERWVTLAASAIGAVPPNRQVTVRKTVPGP